MPTPNLSVPVDRLDEIARYIQELADTEVLVGVPEVADERSATNEISNAALAYIHNFGAPEAHIPQREFMEPGINEVKDLIVERFKAAGTRALEGQRDASQAELASAGLIAQNSIKKRIQSNIPPPLAKSTVLGRIRSRKDPRRRKKLRAKVDQNTAANLAPGAGLFTALIDTGKMIAAITYVLRSVKTTRDLLVGKFGNNA